MKKRGRNRDIRSRVWIWTLLLLMVAAGSIVWSHRQHPRPAPARLAEQAAAKTGQSPDNPRQSSRNPEVAPQGSRTTLSTEEPQQTPSARGQHAVRHGNIEHPYVSATETIVYNTEGRYSFCYAPEHRQSKWVAYKLTGSDVGGGAGRSNSFRIDPCLSSYGWICATNEDYRGSGYDKGHLLPSADRSGSPEENRATFLFSNIAPQAPRLNRGPWKLLEEELRRKTSDYDTLYIITGGVIPDSTAGRIGKNSVTIPTLFYKAVALRRGDRFETVAYVMPNHVSAAKSHRSHEVPLDSVERLTGMRLFPAIRELYVENQ